MKKNIKKNKDPFLSTHALKCAIEDYGFGVEIAQRRMGAQLAGAGLNAALALYEVTLDEAYKKAAIEHADYYKEISAYTAPYYMIPSGVYDITTVRPGRDSLQTVAQISSGVKLSDRYYMKRFWPAENCHNWKEIWVFPSMRWFMLVSDFL